MQGRPKSKAYFDKGSKEIGEKHEIYTCHGNVRSGKEYSAQIS